MSRYCGAKKVEEIVISAIKQDWEEFELRAAAEILLQMRKAEEIKRVAPAAQKMTAGDSQSIKFN